MASAELPNFVLRSEWCRVVLDEIQVMADIGAFAAERGVPQPLRIRVELSIISPASDELVDTFDYTMIHTFAQELATGHVTLLETFADRLARMCLSSAVVIEATVEIDKPRAVPGCLAGVRVKLCKQ